MLRIFDNSRSKKQEINILRVIFAHILVIFYINWNTLSEFTTIYKAKVTITENSIFSVENLKLNFKPFPRFNYA